MVGLPNGEKTLRICITVYRISANKSNTPIIQTPYLFNNYFLPFNNRECKQPVYLLFGRGRRCNRRTGSRNCDCKQFCI